MTYNSTIPRVHARLIDVDLVRVLCRLWRRGSQDPLRVLVRILGRVVERRAAPAVLSVDATALCPPQSRDEQLHAAADVRRERRASESFNF